MRTKQAFKNLVFSLLLQLATAVSGIILPRLFIGAYGSTINGLVTSVTQFITYMSLVESGVGTASMVALYGPLSRGENTQVNQVLSATRMFYVRSGLIFVALVGSMLWWYPSFTNNQLDTRFIQGMILVLAISNLVDYLFLGKYRVLLTSDQRGYVISAAHILGTILSVFLTILLISLGAGAIVVKASVALIFLFRSLLVYLYVKKNYPWIDFHTEPNVKAISQRWDALIHQVVGMICNNTDVILLTFLLGTNSLAEVSVYGVYSLIAYALSGFLNSFSSGLGAGFGQIISNNEQGALKRSFSSFEYGYFLIMFLAYTCMGVLLQSFISLYSASFTDARYVRPELIVLFTLMGALQAIRIPGMTITVAAGHFSQTKGRAIIEAVINLVVSLALIKPFGIAGVVFGTCASYAYRSIDVILYNNKYFLSGTLKTTLLRIGRNIITALLIAAVSLQFFAPAATSWIGWFGYAAVFGVVCLVLFSAVNFVFEPKEFKILAHRALEIIKR